MNWPRLVPLTFLLSVSSGIPVAAQGDVLSRLRVDEATAQERFFSALTGGYASLAGDRAVFKGASAEGRAAMARAVMSLARAYSGTVDFSRRYAAYREEQKPGVPQPTLTGDQVRAQQRKGLEEGIANAVKAAKEMPSMKAEMDAMAAELRAQLAAVGKDPVMNAQVDEGQKAQAAADAESYKQALATWENDYPSDPKRLIASRLREFLALSSTVDFSAATQVDPADHKVHFKDEAHEGMDSRWKLLFRAGKAAVEAARVEASDWLKSLGG